MYVREEGDRTACLEENAERGVWGTVVSRPQMGGYWLIEMLKYGGSIPVFTKTRGRGDTHAHTHTHHPPIHPSTHTNKQTQTGTCLQIQTRARVRSVPG